ncbi:MAG: hypothetical protein IBJ07_03900 [Rhizobiaceae bacterium]|nr:hypothetical protein [Rhizobiaceae bacterium]
MSHTDSLSQRWAEYRPTKTAWFWSGVTIAIATMVIGFTAGGWTTGGTAAEMAEDAARDARAELASAICVHRFAAAPDASTKWAELKDASSYERDNLIEDAGWTTFAAMEEAVPGAADMCADNLVAMESLPTTSAVAAPVSTDG